MKGFEFRRGELRLNRREALAAAAGGAVGLAAWDPWPRLQGRTLRPRTEARSRLACGVT